MSFTLHGIPISGGIAIGHAHLVSNATREVAHYTVTTSQARQENVRLAEAINSVKNELKSLQKNLSPQAPSEMSAFLNLHWMILDDPVLSKGAQLLIEERHCNAEWALVQQMDVLIDQFEQMEDPYLRERKNDVIQVVERVLKHLLGHPGVIPPIKSDEERLVIVAHDLSPADMILFKQHQFAGFVTDLGGATSHTAIVARSLNIPAVVALHIARELIGENELVIVDGTSGVLIVNPDKQILAEYRLRQNEIEQERKKLKRLKLTPTITLDGVSIELHANIELPQDIEQVKEVGATGIGLFRSEFLFVNRDELPGEEEQFEAYKHIAEAMKPQPVTIRTLDLGADKTVLNTTHPTHANPALGLRAIRLCLAEPLLFITQLRAILRASHFGKIQLLIPMLAHAHEIDQTLALIKQTMLQLEQQGFSYDKEIRIGGMIEVPAAALSLSIFTRRLHFLSLGTNDLIQYTLAIDRSDDTVAHLYDPLHPAVLYLVAHTIRTALRANVPITVCGEMAGDVRLTRILLGMGLRSFSMHPSQLLSVKQRILKSNLEETKIITEKILKTDNPQKISELLTMLNV